MMSSESAPENSSMQEDSPSVFSPILQLFIILVPTVANAFLLVYVLLGIVLEGDQHQVWAAEAAQAGLYVVLVAVGFSVLVLAGMKLLHATWRSPMGVVSLVQIGLATIFYLALLGLV